MTYSSPADGDEAIGGGGWGDGSITGAFCEA